MPSSNSSPISFRAVKSWTLPSLSQTWVGSGKAPVCLLAIRCNLTPWKCVCPRCRESALGNFRRHPRPFGTSSASQHNQHWINQKISGQVILPPMKSLQKMSKKNLKIIRRSKIIQPVKTWLIGMNAMRKPHRKLRNLPLNWNRCRDDQSSSVKQSCTED